MYFYYIQLSNPNSMRESRDEIKTFVERLKKIGITVELFGNYPWIYLDSVNGQKVKEKFEAEHGFTIAFLPIRPNQELKFTDISEIFKILRKYGTGDKKE